MAHLSGYEGSITIGAADDLGLNAQIVEWRLRQTKDSWDAFVKKQRWKEKQFGPKRVEVTAIFLMPAALADATKLEILDSPAAGIAVVCIFESTTHKATCNMTMRDMEISDPVDGPCEVTAQFKSTDTAGVAFVPNA